MSDADSFDIYVIAIGDLERARNGSVDFELLRGSAGKGPAFLGLELNCDEARRVAIELTGFGFHVVPVETAYRDRRMLDIAVEKIARGYLAEETKKYSRRRWDEPFLLEEYALDPSVACYRSVSWADDIEDDDLSVTVAVDRVDGHRVTDAELRSRRHRWIDDSGVLEAIERLLSGDEHTQLEAVQLLSRHAVQPASLEALRIAEAKSPFVSVRERIGSLLS